MNLQRNAIYQTAEKAVHTIGGMLGMVLVAQYLGREALADYGFAISLTAFFIPALDLGMNNRIIKAVAAGEDISETLEGVVAYKLGSAPLAVAMMIVGGLILGSGQHVSALVVLVGVSTASMSFGDGASAVFKGLQKSHISCWMITGLNVVLLGSLSCTMLLGWGLVEVGWCYALSRLAYAVAAFLMLRRSIPTPRFSLRIGFDRKTIVDGLFHLPGIYYLGNLLSLTYLATYVMSPGEAGVFYVGYRAAAATYVLVSAGFEAVLASSVSSGQRPSGLGGWFVIYGVIALLLLYVAAPLVSYVFGESFAGSVRPIRLLASCVPTFALCGLGHTLLMAARYERFGSGVLLALLFAGFGMALSSEALFGPEATALVPAISSFFAMVVLWGGLSRHVKQVAVDRFL
jgi:O-antigen/teichoic acid export membrane protein